MTMNPFKHKMCELIVSICANYVLLSCYFGWILLWGRNCAVDKAFRNDPLTVGQRDAVRPILSEYDRVGGVQGYTGTGKTAPVVDEGSLASTREVRELLRLAPRSTPRICWSSSATPGAPDRTATNRGMRNAPRELKPKGFRTHRRPHRR